MSAIRPPVPSPLFPAQTPPSPARASRSDFFRAALDATQPADPSAPAATDTPVRALSQAQTPTGAPEPFGRPGALLDIRV